jgi:hypothetical protein
MTAPRLVCVTGNLASMDVASIESALSRLDEGLQEARAATQLLRDGDTTAMADLDEVIDAMALEIAEIKARTGTTSLG